MLARAQAPVAPPRCVSSALAGRQATGQSCGDSRDSMSGSGGEGGGRGERCGERPILSTSHEVDDVVSTSGARLVCRHVP